jgi:hypothetical protein
MSLMLPAYVVPAVASTANKPRVSGDMTRSIQVIVTKASDMAIALPKDLVVGIVQKTWAAPLYEDPASQRWVSHYHAFASAVASSAL